MSLCRSIYEEITPVLWDNLGSLYLYNIALSLDIISNLDFLEEKLASIFLGEIIFKFRSLLGLVLSVLRWSGASNSSYTWLVIGDSCVVFYYTLDETFINLLSLLLIFFGNIYDFYFILTLFRDFGNGENSVSAC